MGDAARIGDGLTATVVRELEALAHRHAPDLTLPRVFAGHPVGPDAHADLVYTLTLVRRLGIERIGGHDLEPALHRLLATVDGPGTNTFFSYRIAEAVADLGGLDALDPATRPRVLEAIDSTSWIELLDGGLLPRNYAVVLARCEQARATLGVLNDRTQLDELLDRARQFLGEHPQGWLDDSHTGRGQVDMYTVDAYLFAEPFAEVLGEVWERGMRSALDLVATVATPDGSALAWGRSIGALAVCHAAELAGLALRREMVADRARWLGLADAALAGSSCWFADGLVTSHRHRSTFRYRGPFRRLQMTLDCLGKLAAAAVDLRAADRPDDPAAAPAGEVFAPLDRWIAFDDRGAGVWGHRSPGMGFSLPVVGGVVSDYAPAPRRPGLFEVPTDRPLLCWVPVAHRGTTRFGPGGRAASVDHGPGRLRLTYDRLVASALSGDEPEPAMIGARRTAVYEVDGRTLTCTEDVDLDEVPDALAVTIPEALRRPLVVRFETEHPHRVDIIDTDGLAEWRSVFGELPRVHQLDLQPARRVQYRWSVTPVIRVLSTAVHHRYHLALYDPLVGRVEARSIPFHLLDDPDALCARLADADIVHLHWPEWATGLDPDRAARVAATIHDAGVRLLWTQHNLAPHVDPDDDRAYRALAPFADGVHHHSRWGEQEARARFPFRPDALHRVIPHPHFGTIMGDVEAIDRAEAEAELGMAPCRLRFGVVGAPRPGKDTQLVLDGFHATTRDDIQLLVLSGAGEAVPDDPRITVLPYEEVPRPTYDRRLRCMDALVLPLDGASYLTTGQAADALAVGLPCLVSPWPYLQEILGEAGIPYGGTAAGLTATLDGLDDDTLQCAASAARDRRSGFEPAATAEALYGLLDDLCRLS